MSVPVVRALCFEMSLDRLLGRQGGREGGAGREVGGGEAGREAGRGRKRINQLLGGDRFRVNISQ